MLIFYVTVCTATNGSTNVIGSVPNPVIVIEMWLLMGSGCIKHGPVMDTKLICVKNLALNAWKPGLSKLRRHQPHTHGVRRPFSRFKPIKQKPLLVLQGLRSSMKTAAEAQHAKFHLGCHTLFVLSRVCRLWQQRASPPRCARYELCRKVLVLDDSEQQISIITWWIQQ